MASFNEFIDACPIISTHEHIAQFPLPEPVNLDAAFLRSYIGWCGVDMTDRRRFLELLSGNSYFIWYEKALDDLFHFGGELTADNWDRVSDQLLAAMRDPGFHDDLFKRKCGYLRAILDTFWTPGSDDGRPDLFAPTFRINSFLYGFHPDARDHNGNNAQLLYGACASLEEYLAMIDQVIAGRKAAGAVALKSALAYDRTIAFQPTERHVAAQVFGRSPRELTPAAISQFGDFIFDYVCAAAARHNLPFQQHTGLGLLAGSNPLNLIPMIERHPATKFVLFHGGFPWIDEVAALSHNYPNVYLDLCWLPGIAPTAAEYALHVMIEAGRDASRITWGADAVYLTETYAHVLNFRHLVKKVLNQKIAEGYFSESRARVWAERIMFRNAAELYGLRTDVP